MSLTPLSPLRAAWDNRTLISRLIVRDIQSRYRGTMLGLAWALGVPLATLAVYLFVFMHVFSVRWDEGHGSRAEYALILFAGLIAFNLFAECLNRAPSLLLENVGYIKRVVFPLEILPFVSLGSALVHAALSGLVLLACHLAVLGLPPLTALLMPLTFVPLILWVLGLSWLLAALGVYLRDIKPLVGVATTLLLFVSPVFYPVSAVQGTVRALLWLNPLTPLLEDIRLELFGGQAPPFSSMLLAFFLSYLAAWLGFAWFAKTRPGFADVV